MSTELKIRHLDSLDQELLWDMLYIALWDAPDEARRPRSVLEEPAVKRLVESWGRQEDFGLIAFDPISEEGIGAIWARLDGYDQIESYGCDYPFLGIAIKEDNQNKGIGTLLMSRFVELLRSRVEGLRLGVHPLNLRAIRLYEKFGFRQYALGAGNFQQIKLDFKHVEPTNA